MLSALFGRATQLRRSRYARDPQRRRRLRAPVISVGNLSVGGTGKTPVVETLARMLQQAGERPVILSRGYGRRPADGALVVSDADGVRVADAALSGDEPQLLARQLPGVPVVVASERYLAGRLAEARFGATVHLLDDGFQHLELARDVDVLIVPPADLEDRLLPAGRLREPIAAAAAADVILVPGDDDQIARVAERIGQQCVFRLVFEVGAARNVLADRMASGPLPGVGAPVVAVAGIARPQRFFDAVRSAGWQVRSEATFPDHHRYDARDVARIEALARQEGADGIITTGKDAVRLERLIDGSRPPRWAFLPLTATITPYVGAGFSRPDSEYVGAGFSRPNPSRPDFQTWLLDRVRGARA